MEIYKLLDRFELLNDNTEYFSDLRRAYIDKDLSSILAFVDDEELRKAILTKNIHSIFRLVDNKRCIGELEDLRKSVVEQNLHSLFRILPGNDDLRKAVIEENMHSIFRLIENEDLKKVVLDDNVWSAYRLLQDKTSTNFVDAFKYFETNNIEIDEDCFSRGQLKSKKWLIETVESLNLDLGVVFLCAGWYATLAVMIFESKKITVDKIVSFDIDPSVWKIAEIFNKPWVTDNWKFKASTEDIHEIRFEEHIYDVNKSDGNKQRLWAVPNTVINTSCEHIEDFTGWYEGIVPGQLVILQGNNYFEIEEHVNCSKDLQEFSNKAPMSNVLYEGELELPEYKRFMKIGYK
jgi:hypothetical protein